MPTKMETCVICGSTVTKRSTRSLSALGDIREGRACRTHPEVVELLEEKTAKEQQEREIARAERTFKVLTAVSGVRMQHTIQGTPLSVLYHRLRAGGYSDSVISEVKKEVEKLGSRLTKEEMEQAVGMAVHLMTK